MDLQANEDLGLLSIFYPSKYRRPRKNPMCESLQSLKTVHRRAVKYIYLKIDVYIFMYVYLIEKQCYANKLPHFVGLPHTRQSFHEMPWVATHTSRWVLRAGKQFPLELSRSRNLSFVMSSARLNSESLHRKSVKWFWSIHTYWQMKGHIDKELSLKLYSYTYCFHSQ